MLAFATTVGRGTMIALTCPFCQRRMRCHEQAAGRVVKCLACGKDFRVPPSEPTASRVEADERKCPSPRIERQTRKPAVRTALPFERQQPEPLPARIEPAPSAPDFPIVTDTHSDVARALIARRNKSKSRLLAVVLVFLLLGLLMVVPAVFLAGMHVAGLSSGVRQSDPSTNTSAHFPFSEEQEPVDTDARTIEPTPLERFSAFAAHVTRELPNSATYYGPGMNKGTIRELRCTFDVEKTNSLVSPFVATLHIRWYETLVTATLACVLQCHYRFEDGRWVFAAHEFAITNLAEVPRFYGPNITMTVEMHRSVLFGRDILISSDQF